MKLEYITVDSIKSGMKEVAARFGADAVLVKAIADGDKQKLLIAHDNQVRMSSPLPRSEIAWKSLEYGHLAIKSLKKH